MRNEWRQDPQQEKCLHGPWHWSSSLQKAKLWTQLPALAHLSHDALSFPA